MSILQWMLMIVAFVAVVLGVGWAIRANRVAIRRWFRRNRNQVAYGLGLVGGLVVLGFLVWYHPFAALVIAAIVTVVAAGVIFWNQIGRVLVRHWFQILASVVIIASVLWLYGALGTVAPGALLFWTIVSVILVALIVWWVAFWRFVGAHWRAVLGVVVVIILVVALARATPTIANAVSGFWNSITSAASGPAISPAVTSSGASTFASRNPVVQLRTPEEIADCRRRISNTPPYIDPASPRGRRLCGE